MMEPRGIDFLVPISHLIEGEVFLKLANADVKVFYITYVNDFKRQLQPNEHSVRTAINDKLTPGELLYFHLTIDGV